MITQRQLFYSYLAQTSTSPLQLEIVKAEGVYLYDVSGKSYIDLISGISVSNLGHSNPKVINAIKNQLDKYMHLMVYGEYIQTPQVQLAKLLVDNLPSELDNVYFVNSGSEAIEGALKLAKRYTYRNEIISFNNAYHGSTAGALSIMGNEHFKNSFRPLVTGVKFLNYNNLNEINSITNKTACVILETIQGEAGIIVPDINFLKKIRERCNETGTLLIFDEIQTGFGRTGTLFAFQKFNVIPDIFTIAKSMGGGMPLGAFISSNKIMSSLKTNPILGHITTFGGHPVSCAASHAALEELLETKIINDVERKGELFRKYLKHKHIKDIRGCGLFIAIELDSSERVLTVVKNSIDNGVIIDWFLFNDKSIRIAPPLIITDKEIENACLVILNSLESS